ncbi:MAG TPA: hypothetical protein VFT29_16580 [Gemmatimonadaceae bacterium]|nr:hypothetical protein [Gemmatimonadaceae bacterium]
MQMSLVRRIIRGAAPFALISAAACDATGTDRVPVSVSFSGQSPAATAAIMADVAIGDGANTLVITKAQVMLREIELKRSPSTQCSVDNVSADDCEELSVGPFLIDLPVVGNTVTSLTATVPPDTYREIEFEIRKLGDETAAERALAAAHPEFGINSIRVEGTFNGSPFVFMMELDQELELEFNVPVVITDANQNVTIQLDLASWFRVGSTLVNPVSANKDGPNESAVRENIRASIRAFGDDDRNGH